MDKDLKGIISEYDLNRFKKKSKEWSVSELNKILCYLVYKNHYPFIEVLHREGYDFSIMNGRCLFLAIRNNCIEVIRILLKNKICDVNMRNGLPLIRAVEVSNLDAIKEFAKYGLNYRLDKGKAFRMACLRNNLNIVEFLLKKHPAYSILDESVGVHYAILNNNEAMLLLLIKYGSIMYERHLYAAKFSSNSRLLEIVKNHM